LSIKVTTWNLEHSDRLLKDDLTSKERERVQRIKNTLRGIDPDILCIQEGPKGEQGIAKLASDVLDDEWTPALLRQPGEALGHRDDEYDITWIQWIWFLVKPELLDRCQLQSPSVWQSYLGGSSWKVHWWGEAPATNHDHYRHPQVLRYELEGDEHMEFIGVHLKSKINTKRITRDESGNLTGDYLDKAMSNRIKLTTEARNIRDYVSKRFNQTSHPGIVILGDCNDGPARDIFEEHYLYMDLLSNLQGDVIMSDKFFNHALFDYPDHLSWTARYDDKVTGKKAIDNPLLLDHILISQPLCNGKLSLVVNEFAGKVEHEEFDLNNAGATKKALTSDHIPVSCTFDPTEED
jgi:hypothetical protein